MIQLLSFGNRRADLLNIYVKSNNGSTLSVNLNPGWDIKEVKEIVAPQLGLQPSEVKIIFAGKELSDTTTIAECDLGQKSVLHAVKSRSIRKLAKPTLSETLLSEESSLSDDSSATKPLSQTLVDLQLINDERANISPDDMDRKRAHFYVYCAECKEMCPGKLRVRCAACQSGAFTVDRDPQCWDDVLKPERVTGECENLQTNGCLDRNQLPWAEFYFKCANHTSGGERDIALPLNLIKSNIRQVPCLACTDIRDPVLVFPCSVGHVTCLDCFRQYCRSRLMDRQFHYVPEIGYTLPCPAVCEQSYIEEVHHFKLLSAEQYQQFQRFATEEFVLQSGGVLCPQPGCGMGLLIDEGCIKVTCEQGCGYVFCRSCRQGYHLGECLPDNGYDSNAGNCQYEIDPTRMAEARWDDASRITIKVISKPCPKCRTPTERDGGCMHMVCTRSGCNFEWCWVCQTEWTRDCMGAHWFG